MTKRIAIFIFFLISLSYNLYAEPPELFSIKGTYSTDNEVDKGFKEALIRLASSQGIDLRSEKISILPYDECNRQKDYIPMWPVCYSDWWYPAEKQYLLPRYRHHLKHYLLAKQIIYRNLNDRWYGIQAGETSEKPRLLEHDFVEAISLLIEDMIGEKIVIDEDVLQRFSCNKFKYGSNNTYRSILYYIFLKKLNLEHPNEIKNYIQALLDPSREIQNSTRKILKNLRQSWNDYLDVCKIDNTKLPSKAIRTDNYWPSDISATKDIIDLQSVHSGNKPAVQPLWFNIKNNMIVEKENMSFLLDKTLHTTQFQFFNLRRHKNGTKLELRDKGNKASLTPSKGGTVIDFTFNSKNHEITMLTPKLILTRPLEQQERWDEFQGDNFEIKTVSSISTFSFSKQILVTTNNPDGKRIAVLWDPVLKRIAPLISTSGETFAPKWSKDNKGLFFIEKVREKYRAYYLNMLSREYLILYEGVLPLISIDQIDENYVILAAATAKGSALIRLDLNKAKVKIPYTEIVPTQMQEVTKKQEKLDLSIPEKFKTDPWSLRFSPFVMSETRQVLAGLNFHANSLTKKARVDAKVGFDTAAKNAEVAIGVYLDTLSIDIARKLDPLLSNQGWRDTIEIKAIQNLLLSDDFWIRFGANYRNVSVESFSDKRHNIVGPSLGFKYQPHDDFIAKTDYSLLFLTSDSAHAMHLIDWMINYSHDFPIVGIDAKLHGRNTFKDNSKSLWGIAGNRLWPFFQDRQLMIRGYPKTAFFEPHLITCNLEFPLTIYGNPPAPKRSAIWWRLKFVPLADFLINSMKNTDKRMSWSGGGELRFMFKTVWFITDLYTGVYYAHDRHKNWNYNFGGAINW